MRKHVTTGMASVTFRHQRKQKAKTRYLVTVNANRGTAPRTEWVSKAVFESFAKRGWIKNGTVVVHDVRL